MKPNVGHGEGSAGVTSVIKAVLALEHKTIPPNIKFNKPNPQSMLHVHRLVYLPTTSTKNWNAVPFEEKQLIVPVKPTPFPAGKAERISINSFGIGGSNAHVSSPDCHKISAYEYQSALGHYRFIFTGARCGGANTRSTASGASRLLGEHPNVA